MSNDPSPTQLIQNIHRVHD